ncbi:MAG: hypothetical protein KJ015_09715 [Myxococcales bacterium]|nr:hypothetical protein [Myxococcales bacterium]
MIFDPECSLEFCGMRLRLDAEFFVEPAVQQALFRSLARTIAASAQNAETKVRVLGMLAGQMDLQRQPRDSLAVRQLIRRLRSGQSSSPMSSVLETEVERVLSALPHVGPSKETTRHGAFKKKTSRP